MGPVARGSSVSLNVLSIDGSAGEGGGQILRTALGLSLVTGRAFCMTNIRAQRKRPGLQAQHLAAVNAAATVGQATVEGAAHGSSDLTFVPGKVVPGDYHFSTGTAGSTTLVLQTVLPALMMAQGRSNLVVDGGTHNPLAPPYEFLDRTFLPLLARIGPHVSLRLDRHGFYPAGGGRIHALIKPSARLERIHLDERGAPQRCRAHAVIAHLPRDIAERELGVLKNRLGLGASYLRVEEVLSDGPGNVLMVEAGWTHASEIFTGYGDRGLKAEVIASRLAKEVKGYLAANVPVGEYLADQLLLPMALAGGGSFVTLPLSSHATTNIEVIRMFLPVDITVKPLREAAVRVEVRKKV